MSALNDAKKLAKYNNDLERTNVKLQYDYNRALAQEDRSWQERMANSAHQREISDLKAAGLNPVLSVTGGSGASTPGGSATSVSKPDVDMSLPRAVMDMAIAQLNSATALQTTAMNNANALTVAQGTWSNNLAVKEVTSGDSVSGQLRNVGINAKQFYENIPFLGKVYERFKKSNSSVKVSKKNEAFSNLEMSIMSNYVKYNTLKLKHNKTLKDKIHQRYLKNVLKRMKYYYPKQYKNVIRK